MWSVKVDLSPEARKCFENGENWCIPGQWAIYYKKHFWSKWEQYHQTYASKEWAISEANKIAQIPYKIK